MALHGTLLFHLNLRYSAIEREDRAVVVEHCYRPLLRLLDELPWLVLAVEATGHTLEMISDIDPDWVDELAARWKEGRVELVGSGDTQLIGPLVPASVNRWNQNLGQATYRRLLGRMPEVALVNEMAWSQGLVDAYRDAGYRTVVTEWNNPHKHHREWSPDWRYRMATTESPSGRQIELAWVDSVAFQKFQRVVHDDLDVDEYVDWVRGLAGEESRHVFLYASDAEIFDYRPGRYETEATLGKEGEWGRMRGVLESLRAADVCFTLPSKLRDEPDLAPRRTLCLRSAADPVPVKKQPKYNVTRWALTGREDVLLNASCFARARALEARGGSAEEWRALCRSWASDLRTHLTDERWDALRRSTWCDDVKNAKPAEAERVGSDQPIVRTRGRRLELQVGGARARFSLRRGLAIEALSFAAAGKASLLGTVPHGGYDDIDWAADFYSGHLVVDVPAHRRITDLGPVEPEIDSRPGRVTLTASVPTPFGPVTKRLTLTEAELVLAYDLSAWSERPLGSTRLGFITFEPTAFGDDVCITSACGGPPESFPLVGEFDHGASVSPLVSARAAFGASDGLLSVDDGQRGIELQWSPEVAAALPLVTHRVVAGRRFLRVAFSLGEIDETVRPGRVPDSFQLAIRPRLEAA